MQRLRHADRLWLSRNTLRYVRYLDDFPVVPFANVWDDTMGEREMLYAVQTNTKVIERCLLMTTDPGDLVFDPTCVRKGTRVFTPTSTLPVGGEGAFVPPSAGGLQGGQIPPSTERPQGKYIPIESLRPGDFMFGHDGKPHRVLRVIRKPYRGLMIGICHAHSQETLWLTADHRVLAKPRPRTLGGHRDWSGVAPNHLERGRQLRREASPMERRLWSALRNKQLGFKFRRQHPIGPYITDFYSREAHLVVEVDGSSHFIPKAIAYDAERDAYLRAFGLDVLRFTTTEVEQNLEGVCLAIQNQCHIRTESLEGAQWIQAGALQPGDLVFFGAEQRAVPFELVESQFVDEEVYDLEIEGAHSFLTEVCVVHNCGSGTTAYCAEKWGRRWIICDTSRVALAIARQRLMTARYDYYELADSERGPAGGFIYETVPHITLESIAHNAEIDEIAAKYQPQIDRALAELNRALSKDWKEWEVPRELPPTQPPPPTGEEQQTSSPSAGRAGEGQQTSSPSAGRAGEGQQTSSLSAGRVGEGAPSSLAGRARVGVKEAHERFWTLKRQKRQAIDTSIQRHAPQETLYDRPQVRRGVVRVSGPFTVEAILVPAVEDPTQAPIPPFEEDEARTRISDRGGNYLTTMLNLLNQQGGVLFPGGKKMALQNLRALNFGYLHAEAEAVQNGKTLKVSLSFGPQYGPVTATQVAEAIPTARNNVYDVLIFAGFSFDPEAQAFVQRAPVRGLEVHLANIAPDVLVGDLLKTSRTSQIFTVFDQPDVRISPSPMSGRAGEGDTYTVELRGVDIYDPLTGETQHTRGSDVAAWFLDTDYDGMTFHICQAFFPGDADAWQKLQRALKAQIDPEAFEQMRGAVSFPFEPGEHQRIAVKVIDFRENEVVRVVKLGEVRA